MKHLRLFSQSERESFIDSGLVLREVVNKGKGVFATKFFKKNEKILDFAGELFTFDQLPESELDGSAPSYYMQIGLNLYQGPSEKPETYTNHSCDPNCGVIINGAKAILIAVRDIQKGEEITWDYSTTMTSDIGNLSNCFCGSVICRKSIGSFRNVSRDIQRKYIKLGIVPNYVIESCIDIRDKGWKKAL